MDLILAPSCLWALPHPVELKVGVEHQPLLPLATLSPEFWASPAHSHPPWPHPPVVVPLGQYNPAPAWVGPRDPPHGLFTPTVSTILAFL